MEMETVLNRIRLIVRASMVMTLSPLAVAIVDIADIPELSWMEFSGVVLPENAFPLFDDGDTQYYSCRPVYLGDDEDIARLYMMIRGTVSNIGRELNGGYVCDYQLYAPRSLNFNRRITTDILDDRTDIHNTLNQVEHRPNLYDGSTPPNTVFELLVMSEESNNLFVTNESETLTFEALGEHQALYLNDIETESPPPSESSESPPVCGNGFLQWDIEDDTFCFPYPQYCLRRSAIPYFSDPTMSSVDDHRLGHPVVGITFFHAPKDNSFIHVCNWHQEPAEVDGISYPEITAGLSGFSKVVFNFPPPDQTPVQIRTSSTVSPRSVLPSAMPEQTSSVTNTEMVALGGLATAMIIAGSIVGLSTVAAVAVCTIYFVRKHRRRVSGGIELAITGTSKVAETVMSYAGNTEADSKGDTELTEIAPPSYEEVVDKDNPRVTDL